MAIRIAKICLAGGLTLAGMAGLYLHVEYSGWVLLIGLIAVIDVW